jgi:hypothetical protein
LRCISNRPRYIGIGLLCHSMAGMMKLQARSRSAKSRHDLKADVSLSETRLRVWVLGTALKLGCVGKPMTVWHVAELAQYAGCICDDE